jgi:hypothetical protein
MIVATAIDVRVRENSLQNPIRKPALVVSAEVAPGSVLIREGTSLPDELNLRLGKRCGWNIPLGFNAFGFERRLAVAGWNYFFIVPSRRITRFGLSRETAVTRALNVALQQVEKEQFNSAEIISLEVRKWMGIYRVRLTVNARHVRNSPFLRDLDPYARIPRVWDFRRVFDKINRDNPQIKAM